MIDSLRGAIDEVILALGPLIEATNDPRALEDLLADLGWTPDSAPQPLLELANAGSDLISTLDSDPEEVSTVQAINSVKRLVDAIDAIRTKPDAAFPSGIDVASFKATIGRDIFDYLLVDHLLRNRHKLGGLLRLAGLIRLVEAPATGLRQPYLRRQVAWNAIGDLLTDPARGFREAFDWNSAEPRLTQALGVLGSLLEHFGLQFSYFQPTGDLLRFAISDATAPIEAGLGVDLAFGDELGAPAGFAAGLQLLVRPPTAVRGPAISLLPYARLNGARDVVISDKVVIFIRGDVDFTKGIAITLTPERPPEIQAGFLGGVAISPADIQIGLKVTTAPDEPDRLVLGTPDASRLSIRTVNLSGGARGAFSDGLDVFVALDLENAQVVIKPVPGESDSFLASFLGEQGISAELSFGLRLSSLTGFQLTDSRGLEASFPVGVRLGPVDVQEISIGLKTNGQNVDFEVGAAVRGNIGPVTVVVDRVGFQLTARFPDPPTGNLGPVDLGAGFVSPSGIGLVVDAGPVTGGGLLGFDPERAEYAGEMHLQFEGIAVRATGLLTTRLPDGSDGFSLLVVISSEFPPVQLGLGFRLVGVGGLVGINRTVAVEALRGGLKTGALGAVLSPPDPVANAAQLVASIAGLFPPAAGRHVFGPVARIVWGSPTLITIDVCLVLELPAPVRLVVLGRLRAVLPDEREAIVRIQMDLLGVVDFDRHEAAVDATLIDSRLAQFALTGDMAMRMSWGVQPSFLLAVGGFHPRFAAPPGFPVLQRVAVALATGENPKLRLEAYLALTSNTVQLGARVDLAARAGRFSVAGFLSFDALVTLQPLAFTVDIAAKLAVKAGGHTLLSVSLQLTLSGPQPWRARGRASFSILFFDISFGFDITIGDDTPLGLPSPIDVASLVLAALADTRSWSAQLPTGGAALVTLRALDPGTEVLAHPLGTLEVRQRVAPLERTLQRFGSSVPSGARRFTITSATIGPTGAMVTGVQDLFAPAQFQELSDEQKLSLPSFESMPSGAVIGTHHTAHGTPVNVNIIHEQKLVTATGITEPEHLAIPSDVFITLTAVPPAHPATFTLTGVS